MQNEKIHKRGRYAAECKEKVALEALTGAKTHAQIASEYGISPDLVKVRKKQAKEMLGECFRRGGRMSEMEKKDNCSPLMYRENHARPLPANFGRDFSAPARLTSLRSAPSLRSKIAPKMD